MVDSYRVQYSYFVDKQDPGYEDDWNVIHNTARVFTPADRAVEAPSDTPYSFLGADLRAEPLVLTMRPIEAGRYFSVQLIDANLLVANPVNRYLINSPMLNTLTNDRGLTLYVQNQSPGVGQESNWLPAPQGLFPVIMRPYWPKGEALNSQWSAPRPQKV